MALAVGLFALLVTLAAAHAAPDGPFLRRPDIHGDRVVFTSEGDLWLASVSGGAAQRITNAPGVETEPRFSPDGTRIAFVGYYDGSRDVYVMPTAGGAPERLTWDAYNVRVVGWTPDGKHVLYTSGRNNPERRRWLHKVPANGGMPEPLPIPWVAHAAMDRDGKRVAYVPVSSEWQHWKRYAAGQADDIWLADIAAKTFRRLTTDPGVDTTPTWAGGMIYFVSERDGAMNLYRMDPADAKPAPVTRYRDDEVAYPASDGRRVVFQHGNGLGLYDPATGAARDLNIRLQSDQIHTRERRVNVADNVRWTSVGPTGKRVLLESRGQIVSVPAKHGEWRVVSADPGARAQYPAWSNDGEQMAFVSDRTGEEQIWIMPADGKGEARQLTRENVGPLGKLVWSPNDKQILTSDRESRILLVDVKTGAATTVDQFDRGGTYGYTVNSYSFSPDGKWIAYHRLEPNWQNAIFLYNVADKKKIRVTEPWFNSWNPAFDPEGKYLAFVSDRDFQPTGTGHTQFFGFDKTAKVYLVTLSAKTESPFLPRNDSEGREEKKPEEKKPEEKKPDAKKPDDKKPEEKTLPETVVDVEGIGGRILEVPLGGDRYDRVVPVKDRLLLLVGAETGGATTLRAFNMKDPEKREVKTIAGGVNNFEVSADGKKALVSTGQRYTLMDVGADSLRDDDRLDLSTIRLVVDPKAEWKQIYHEAWRVARDFFYDPGMHGVDWKAVRNRYAAKLPSVGHRSELNEVIGDMLSELSVGHAYVGGGDMSGLGAPTMPMAYLGADFEPVPDKDAVKITKILAGDGFEFDARSPLLAPGLNVKAGDYILAVGGLPVRRDRDIQSLLVGAVGRTLSLTVNDKPTPDGARDILVRPMASEAKARYYDWVEGRREYVRRNGGENLAYIHIPDMGSSGLTEFTKHYYAAVPDKEGIVYDVRYNGGGYIAAMLMMQMASKPVNYFKPRYGESWTYEGWAFRGHSVAICNDQDYSCAEYFVDLFQKAKLGPVFGTVTGGGLVGSGGGYTLVDGGRVNIPNYAAWSPDGYWVVEGKGAIPDVIVEQDPAAVLAGKDPQLDAAIAHLKKTLKESPLPKLAPPPFPHKAAAAAS